MVKLPLKRRAGGAWGCGSLQGVCTCLYKTLTRVTTPGATPLHSRLPRTAAKALDTRERLQEPLARKTEWMRSSRAHMEGSRSNGEVRLEAAVSPGGRCGLVDSPEVELEGGRGVRRRAAQVRSRQPSLTTWGCRCPASSLGAAGGVARELVVNHGAEHGGDIRAKGNENWRTRGLIVLELTWVPIVARGRVRIEAVWHGGAR